MVFFKQGLAPISSFFVNLGGANALLLSEIKRGFNNIRIQEKFMKSHRILKWMALLYFTFFAAVTHECLQAQKKKIPKRLPVAVITSFQKTYLKARIYSVDVEQKDSIVYYTIECRDVSVYRNIVYTADGSIYEKGESVSPKSLLEGIRTALNNRFRRCKLLSAQKTIRDTALVGYTVKLTSGKKTYAVGVDSSDTVVRVKEIKRGGDYQRILEGRNSLIRKRFYPFTAAERFFASDSIFLPFSRVGIRPVQQKCDLHRKKIRPSFPASFLRFCTQHNREQAETKTYKAVLCT
jgi:hypothetical protein